MAPRPTPRIGFRRHFRVASVPGETSVYLVSARGTVALAGEQIQILAPLLDGSHDLAGLQRRVADRLSPGQLRRLLATLARDNLVGLHHTESPVGDDPAAAAYWDLAGGGEPDPDRSAVRLEVLARPGSALDAAAATAALRSAGVPVTELDTTAAPALVLCDDYLDPRLATLNARQIAAGRPWLVAKPTGPDLWVGPVFRPGGGPCWECLATRLRGYRRGEALLDRAGVRADVPEASLPVTRGLGLQLAALEATKWLAGPGGAGSGVRRGEGAGPDAVWVLDTLSLEFGPHPVQRRPQCPVCGDVGLVAERMRAPVTVGSRPKAAGATGNGHRVLAPGQVWQRYRHLVDPVSGIVESIRRDPRCPDFLHSYLSGPNRAVGSGGMAGSRAGLRQQSGGKGRTDLEARVSALCEAVERYCGSRLGDEPTVRGSLRELGEAAIHPDRCQLFHELQYAERHRWNAVQPELQQIPEPFDDTEVLDWSPIWSLTGQRQRLLPTDLLFFTADRHPSVRATSNGNAAGASLEDAILQGLLELVERDAVALWWYNRTRHPAVALSSFDDPWIADLRGAYARIGREFWVLDVSSDLGVPVMAAISRRTDKPAEDLMLGFGAHLDPAVALVRALTELGQLLPAVVDARPDGTGYRAADPHIQWWWQTATAANQPYLRPDERQPSRRRGDYAYTARTDLRDDVEHLVALAAGHGLEVLVVDQTRPDIELPVVKVVVPGLRHFWARLAPGRLYDVPVRLGRLATPTPYAGLNPIPLFL